MIFFNLNDPYGILCLDLNVECCIFCEFILKFKKVAAPISKHFLCVFF